MASLGRYALGAAGLAVICAALSFAAVAIRRRALADWTGAPARLAETVIGLALLIGILELLGAVGLFAFVPVLAASVLAALLARRWASLRSASLPDDLAAGPKGEAGMPSGPSPRAGRPVRSGTATTTAWLATVLALLAAATVLAEWGALSIQSYNVGIRGFDSLWYHLPWAASFAQTGNVVSLRFTDVEYLTPFYPATAEMLHGLGIVLLGRDTLSPGFNLVWLALTLLAAYCIGRPRGVGAATLLGAALAMATTMMDYSQAGAAANDIVAVFFLLAAVALLMTAPEQPRGPGPGGGRRRPRRRGQADRARARARADDRRRGDRPARAPARHRRPVAGTAHPGRRLLVRAQPDRGRQPDPVDEPARRAAHADAGAPAAHRLLGGALPGEHRTLWSRFVEPALASGLGRWWWAVLAVAVAGPLLCLLPERGSGRNGGIVPLSPKRPVAMLGAAALFSLAAYLITPETAAGPAGDPLGFAFNLRYLAPALTLSLAVAPLAPPLTRTPAARTATAIGLAVLMAGTVAQPRLWPATHTTGAILIGAAALALLALTRTRLAIVAAAILALIVAGYPLQRHYLRGRYVYHPNVSSLAPVWAQFRTIHDARVGIVGTFGGFFSYPLSGLDDSNRVQYLAQRGPHGSFTPIATCARWRAQVNTAHLDYLITTPARDPWHPRVLSRSPEGTWTSGDPAAQPVYREDALGQPIVVYRIRGPLDPAGCG